MGASFSATVLFTITCKHDTSIRRDTQQPWPWFNKAQRVTSFHPSDVMKMESQRHDGLLLTLAINWWQILLGITLQITNIWQTATGAPQKKFEKNVCTRYTIDRYMLSPQSLTFIYIFVKLDQLFTSVGCSTEK